ncbi:MAG: hypothetical protein ACXWIZ_16410, partial [Caldimonas sp.]
MLRPNELGERLGVLAPLQVRMAAQRSRPAARRIDEHAVDPATLPAPLRHNLPDWLAEPLLQRLGAEFWPWVEAVDAPAPL